MKFGTKNLNVIAIVSFVPISAKKAILHVRANMKSCHIFHTVYSVGNGGTGTEAVHWILSKRFIRISPQFPPLVSYLG